jgi:hypothetical protein
MKPQQRIIRLEKYQEKNWNVVKMYRSPFYTLSHNNTHPRTPPYTPAHPYKSCKVQGTRYKVQGTIYKVRGASKIKLKKVNKKRTVTARRVIIFFEYLKASIADLITLLFSSLQNSEGGGGGDIGDSCADPCQTPKN